jgi:hypothetical protein
MDARPFSLCYNPPAMIDEHRIDEHRLWLAVLQQAYPRQNPKTASTLPQD